MRISDWSSDVCSSDLPRLAALHDGELVVAPRPRGGPGPEQGQQLPGMPFPRLVGAVELARTRIVVVRLEGPRVAVIAFAQQESCSRQFQRGIQIGRALCRERVGKSV